MGDAAAVLERPAPSGPLEGTVDEVLRGGALKYTSATRLAEAILMAAGITPATRAENGDG